MLDPAAMAARRFGHDIALVDDHRALTFIELDRRVGALARVLAHEGLVAGDRVAIMTGNRIAWFDATLATLRGGYVRSNINDRLAVTEITAILEDLEPSALIYAADYSGIAEQIPAALAPARIRVADEEYETRLAETDPAPPRDILVDGQVELIRYTSGTTGRPKGVLQTAQARATWTAVSTIEMDIRPGDVVMHSASLNFAASNLPWPSLWAGAKQVIQASFNEDQALDLIARHSVTHSVMVPTMINRLAEAAKRTQADVSSLRGLMYGAAPFAKAQLQAAVAALGNVFVGSYGMSEFNAISFLPRDQHDPNGERLSSCGRPHLLADLRIVGPDGRVLGSREIGDIEVRGLQATPGYWRLPEDSKALQRGDGWIATNDVGFRDEDGYLFIIDRKSDIINSGGFNIYPREIEEVLAAHPAVREGVVVGVADEQWGETVCAVVHFHGSVSASEQELDAWCRERIASYKVPRRYVFSDTELPKNSGGKFIRRELRDRVRKVTHA